MQPKYITIDCVIFPNKNIPSAAMSLSEIAKT